MHITQEEALAVALDGLREAYGDDMQAIASDVARIAKMEVWILERAFQYEGETLLGIYLTHDAVRAAAVVEHEKSRHHQEELQWRLESGGKVSFWRAESGNSELWISKQTVMG